MKDSTQQQQVLKWFKNNGVFYKKIEERGNDVEKREEFGGRL